jgi:hypothetical protein
MGRFRGDPRFATSKHTQLAAAALIPISGGTTDTRDKLSIGTLRWRRGRGKTSSAPSAHTNLSTRSSESRWAGPETEPRHRISVSVQDRYGNATHAHFTLFVVECEAAHTSPFQILAQVCQRNDRLVREPLTDACRDESVPGGKNARSAATSLRPCRMPDAGRSQTGASFRAHRSVY